MNVLQVRFFHSVSSEAHQTQPRGMLHSHPARLPEPPPRKVYLDPNAELIMIGVLFVQKPQEPRRKENR